MVLILKRKRGGEIKKDIIEIRDETAQGNMNISLKAEEILEEYAEIFV